MSENKTWAKDLQYDSLWKWFNRLQDIIIELDEIGHKLTAKEWRILKGACVTNFIWPYLHQFFDDSHGIKASLKPLRRPFDRYQSHLEAINNGRDIRQINW